MGAVNTNGVSLAALREQKYGQLPENPKGEYLEPNEISTYGAELTTTARQPISKYRMSKKGTITDISSAVQFGQDTTASLLLHFLAGGIYSHWQKRPYLVRKECSAIADGEQTDPHFRGEYPDIDAAILAITDPQSDDWWNNTTDGKEWVYTSDTEPNAHYRGTFANATTAEASISNPATGDFFDNEDDGKEWDYVNRTEPNPNYRGEFADADAATAAIQQPINFATFWDNTTTNTEWDYDGTQVPTPGYVGTFANEAAATAAVTNPKVGDWWNNTTTNTEWNCQSITPKADYVGEYASESDIPASVTPATGMWWNNTTTNTEWEWSDTDSEWQDSNRPAFTTAVATPTWQDSGNAVGTRPTFTVRMWKDTEQPIGSTPHTITVKWEASSRNIGATPHDIPVYWEATTDPAGTHPTTITSAGGFKPTEEMAGAIIPNTLIYVRGFVNEANNGLKVVSAESSKELITVSDMGMVAEPGNDDTSLFVCGYQGEEGDIKLNAAGNLTSTNLDFTTLGLEPGSGIFIGGLGEENRFDGQNYGLCRIRNVEPHLLTLDKRPNAFTADTGAEKKIHLYFGWLIHDVAVDDENFKQHSFTFEVSYPELMENGKEGFEYAVGQVVNTMEISLPLSDKSTTTIATIGKDVLPTTGERTESEIDRPLFQEAFSTPNDFIRLRLEKVDGYGLSTLFKECTLTLNNNAGGENVLAHLGPMFTNYGNFDVTMSFQCIFTSPEVTKMIRNNCTVTMDWCLVNNDGAFYFDIPSMTLGGGGKNFTTNEKVKIDLTSSAFGDPEPGYTVGITFFPYLPNPKADACA